MKRILRRALVGPGIAASALIALEALCRLREPGPFTFFDRSPYVSDPLVGWRHRPGFRGSWDTTPIEINRLGYRGPELPAAKAPGELRLLCIGDSCTFGKGVLYEKAYPARLEALLRAPNRPVRAFDAGVTGYSIPQYVEVFRQLDPLVRPDVVTIALNINDFPNAVLAAHERVYEGRRLRAWVPLRDTLGRFALYRFLRAKFNTLNEASDWAEVERLASSVTETPENRALWEASRARLREIFEGARARDASLFLFIFPFESQVYLSEYAPAPIARVEEFAREESVPFVDLIGEFRAARDAPPGPGEGAPLFLEGDRYHPTPRGHRIVAEAVARAIEKAGALDRAPPPR